MKDVPHRLPEQAADAQAHPKSAQRRKFLKTLMTGGMAAGVAAAVPGTAVASTKPLLVWSCGGLAEAMHPAHAAYKQASGVEVSYTGAFAAALGKSLLSGSGHTDVFAGRVLALAKNLRKAGKMLHFRPLCFTTYGIAVPKGNPGKITTLEDLTKTGVRVAMSPMASAPGGQAVMGILKKAKLVQPVMKNVLDKQASCVQRTVEDVIEGRADAMIVERRICRIPRFAPHLDFIDIPEDYFPEGPLTFTVGVMADAADKKVAEDYVQWITGEEGQGYFARAGFIPAISAKGQDLVEKLGVHDEL